MSFSFPTACVQMRLRSEEDILPEQRSMTIASWTALHYVFNVYKKSRGSIEAAYVTRLDLASHWHIFSFKCSSCHGEVEYQKIILVRSSPHELLTEIGWNSWKNGCQNSVNIHHCFYEHGATVAKRKENNAAALHLSHWISWFVNNSIIWGYNDHQNVSKFSPYRVGQFVTKTGPIYTCICELLLKGRVFLIELNSVWWRSSG